MTTDAEWQDALDFLYGFVNWETKPAGTLPSFELDRIGAILAALGDPHHAWPAVHIGGTNGKGSTAAFVAAALSAAGRRVGLYTSPHMHTVRERVRVDGAPIGRDEVVAWIARRRAELARHDGVTTFEALTALACETFARHAVDVGVIEVGLGGRLDTTRVVRPVVSVLTSIGLDHREILGDTLRQIASDKVGILRPGVPVVSAPQADEARVVIEAEADRLGCPLWVAGRDARCVAEPPTPRGQTLRIAVAPPGAPAATYTATVNLLGAHQRTNASVAALTLHALVHAGWDLDHAALERGLAAARWPGRFECFRAPGGGPDAPWLVVDGAHNPPAVETVLATLDEVFPDRAATWFILGIGGGKDRAAMLDLLAPAADRIVTARADHPKALAAAALAEEIASRDVAVEAAATPADAVARVLAAAGAGTVIVATGSIFLGADVREALADLGWLVLPDRDPPTSARPARP